MRAKLRISARKTKINLAFLVFIEKNRYLCAEIIKHYFNFFS